MKKREEKRWFFLFLLDRKIIIEELVVPKMLNVILSILGTDDFLDDFLSKKFCFI